jgi:hypothetical protein
VTIPAKQSSPFPVDPDDRVMTLAEWCQVNRFSLSTGLRIRHSGKGPKEVALSDRRRGITVRADREWKAAGGAVQAAE